MQALIRAGVHVSHSSFDPDILLTSPDTRYVLDSIYFENIGKPEQQIPPGCLGLVHHLNSLYPLSEEHFEQKERHILERCGGFIVSSRFTSAYLNAHGFKEDAICIIEPAPSFQHVREKIIGERVHALMVGSVTPRKGQLQFLESLAKEDISPHYTLTIIGSLTSDSMYAKQCAAVILQDNTLRKCVRLLGEQDPEAIKSLYTRSNLYISTSHMETYGMAIQDAVACSMPVLALEGGYAAEHVAQGINGYHCDSINQLVNEFGRCVMDAGHFKAMQERAITWQPVYKTWDKGASTLLDYLG